MPNKSTFTIKPIKQLLDEEVNYNDMWIDPYSGGSHLCMVTNDLNPKHVASFHLDALEFLTHFNINEVDGVLLDPPYSLRQLKECYDSIGIKPDPLVFRGDYIAKQKDIISRIIKPNGKAICFGWNSIGIGKNRGFELQRVLLVCHGRCHNDTIVTVERKINHTL